MSPTHHSSSNRIAFTLVELLVVIAIIGVLIGMAVPAMQNMRELARRSNCEQNLVQISLALSEYSMQQGHYPSGSIAAAGPVKSEPIGFDHNWIIGLLPMIDGNNVYEAIDQSVSVYDPKNKEVRALRIPKLLCPSASEIRQYTSCYAGSDASTETPIDTDNDGVFILNQPLTDDDISDGLSYTLFVGEKLSAYDEDLGWMSGTRSTLRNTGHAINAERKRIRGPLDPSKSVDALYVGGFASDHPGGAYLLMGSGEIRFRSDSMDAVLLKQIGSRADGGLPIQWQTDEPGGVITVDTSPAAAPAEAESNAAAAEN